MQEELGVILLLAVIILAIFIYLIKYKEGNIDIFKYNIYLDNNGTTMMCDSALEYYNKGTKYGNASSSYAFGAKNVITESDNIIKNWIQSNFNIIYTSGATESNNTIIKSLTDYYLNTTGKPHIILSSYEHKSSVDCAKMLEKEGRINLTLVDPDMYGKVDPLKIYNAITEETKLISVMHINNEIGTINNIKEICQMAKSKNPGICFHSDIVQSFGKFSIPISEWNIDAVSASYHKFYGPTGMGILAVNPVTFAKIQKYPLISGSQNNGARGGTVNISGIYGGIGAMKFFIDGRDDKNQKLFDLKKYIVEFLCSKYEIGNYQEYVNQPDSFTKHKPFGVKSNFEIIFLGNNPLSQEMSPNTLLLSVIKYGPIQKHFCNIQLKRDLQHKNIIVSIGSACHSDSTSPSHVLFSIKAPFVIRCGVIRISLGDYNSASEIKKFCKILSKCIELQSN